MKIMNKILSGILLIGGISMTVSCDKNKDIDYKPAKGQGMEVFFAGNAQTKFNVSKDESWIQIPVYRNDKSGALTVNVIVNPIYDEEFVSPYTFDTKAVFEDGEEVGYITVTYDIADLNYDEPMSYELTLDTEYTTPYAPSSETVTIQYPSPWTVVANVVYSDTFLFDGGYPQELELSQNDLNPYLFRVPNPYYDTYNEEEDYFVFKLLQDGETYVMDYFGMEYDMQITGDNWVGYQPYYIWTDEGIDFYYAMPSVWDLSDAYNYVAGYLTEESNGVQIPAHVVLSPILMDPIDGYWYGDTSRLRQISIVANGYDPKDYNLEVTYEGMLTAMDGLYALADVVVGEDIETVKVGVASGKDIESIASAIESGKVSSVEIATTQTVKVPFDSSNPTGLYSVVAVAYSNGEIQASTGVTFNYFASNYDPNEGWTSLGYVDYTDGYVCSSWFLTNAEGEPGIITYSLELQQNNTNSDVYRLVNPYGASFPINKPGEYDPYGYYYLEVNVEDPDRVFVYYGPQALDWGEGELACFSLAGYLLNSGVAPDDVDDAADAQGWIDEDTPTLWGKFADGKITFEPFALMVFWGDEASMANYALDYYKYLDGDENPFIFNDDGSFYAPFCIDMSSLSSTPNPDAAIMGSTRSGSMQKNMKWNKGKKLSTELPKLSSKMTVKKGHPEKRMR